MDPLIGRDEDLAALLDLHSRARLVTLTGAGGSGKTRLVQAAVAGLREAGREVWFVDCSTVSDVEIVGATIAAAMDVQDAQGLDALDLVIATLRGREAVLALDNLEQISGAGGVVVRLLDAVPGLSIVATSRRPLRARGEVEFAVQPLALPSEASAAGILGSPAGALFVARSGAVTSSSSLDETSAVEISALLHRLDGLPLAIELAAARTRALSPREINRRLDERGPEGIDAGPDGGHRSLRSIMDWTLGQLTPDELETLEAVSICAGFDLSLVRALLPERDVLPAVESLIAFGLVRRAESVGGASRFTLLQTIQAATKRGIDPERSAAWNDRHAAHFLALAADWEQTATKRHTRELTALMDADADNVRRALDHLEAVDPDRGVALMARLKAFWSTHGRAPEGWERFQRALATTKQPSIELARAAVSQLFSISDALSEPEHIELAELAVRLARAVNDRPTLEEALRLRAFAATHEESLPKMQEIVAEMEAITSEAEADSRLRLMEVHLQRSNLEDGRTSDRYVQLLRAVLVAQNEAGLDAAHLTSVELAAALFGRGEYDEALQLARAAKATYLGSGLEILAWFAMWYEASSLAELRHPNEAVDAFLQLAEITFRVRSQRCVVDALEAAIPVALVAGQPELAARVYGCLVRRAIGRDGFVVSQLDRDLLAGWLRRIERDISTMAMELAMRDGEGSDPGVLLASLPDALRGPATKGPRGGDLRHGALTKRELEVLTLVGRGHSDPEIAEALYISPKTASVHVANIKGKLGAESRLEIALRARDLGLVDS